MKKNLVPLALIVGSTLSLSGCSSFPGEEDYASPWGCPADVGFGAQDMDGDDVPDGWGPRIIKNFVTGCTTPGEEFAACVYTVMDGSNRVYRLELFEGPGDGLTWDISSHQDFVDVVEEIMVASDFDPGNQDTADYIARVVEWAREEWVSPDTYHTLTGY